jgi:hypothetical protein
MEGLGLSFEWLIPVKGMILQCCWQMLSTTCRRGSLPGLTPENSQFQASTSSQPGPRAAVVQLGNQGGSAQVAIRRFMQEDDFY